MLTVTLFRTPGRPRRPGLCGSSPTTRRDNDNWPTTNKEIWHTVNMKLARWGKGTNQYASKQFLPPSPAVSPAQPLIAQAYPDLQARDPGTPPSTLGQMEHDPSLTVRRLVAANPDCPPDMLERLAQDPEFWVCFAVAGHPNTPPAALERLAEHPNRAVREKVADHPNTPATTRTRIWQSLPGPTGATGLALVAGTIGPPGPWGPVGAVGATGATSPANRERTGGGAEPGGARPAAGGHPTAPRAEARHPREPRR